MSPVDKLHEQLTCICNTWAK